MNLSIQSTNIIDVLVYSDCVNCSISRADGGKPIQFVGAPPPTPTPIPPTPIPPTDPCDSVKKQLAATQAQNASLQKQLTDSQAKVATLETQLKTAQALTVTLQAKVTKQATAMQSAITTLTSGLT